MPSEMGPRKLQRAVHEGFKRLENFRRARLMFLRDFTGQYFDKDHGIVGNEPLNLTFNALSVIVPNIVMTFPRYTVKSEFVAYRQYGDLLGMALEKSAKEIKLTKTLRAWVVDAFFCMGILKTGLCESGQSIAFDESDRYDVGQIYTESVDFDNFVFDPSARSFETAGFVGDRIQMPRQNLLDSGLYKNDLIERLPPSGTDLDNPVDELSMQNINRKDVDSLQDLVDIVELWIPDANALVTIPGSSDFTADDFLRVTDYYGPNSGPYTYLRLTPPVPNNPLPVAPIGIWHDLHVRANRMMSKIMDQAERQKDILGYKRANADDAQEIIDAADGESAPMDDPSGAKIFSFGGQQRSNEAHLNHLQYWFNMMSGNTEAMGGFRSDASTATQAQILQANGTIRIEDLRNIVYEAAAEEGSKRAWYLHTDPLIEVPLTARYVKPAKYVLGPNGAQMVSPAEQVDQQVVLTPEMRRGDFLNFQFEIQPKSMSRLEPAMRLQRAMEFAVKLIPAAASATAVCMQMGIPFSFPAFVRRMAKEMEIEWIDEVFYDPEFQMQMAEIMLKTPAMEGSQGTTAPRQQPNAGLMGGMMQNGQPANIPNVTPAIPPIQEVAQRGAVPAQENMPTNQPY
ncbi:MAG: hypothetical protein ABIH23_22060 [bacterium]